LDSYGGLGNNVMHVLYNHKDFPYLIGGTSLLKNTQNLVAFAITHSIAHTTYNVERFFFMKDNKMFASCEAINNVWMDHMTASANDPRSFGSPRFRTYATNTPTLD
jgi:hypothetical protein